MDKRTCSDEGKIKVYTHNYQCIIERYLLPELGGLRLDTVTGEVGTGFLQNTGEKSP